MYKTDYSMLHKQLQALLEGETNWLANLANTAALLYHGLEDINWAGFYLLEGDELILGPFQGKPACVRVTIRGIKFSRSKNCFTFCHLLNHGFFHGASV